MRLEDGTVAVIQSITLPAQPTTAGVVEYIPLGGNGLSAPQAAYGIMGMQVTGATGGGSAQLRITMDNRFTALLSYCTIGNTQATPGDADVRFTLSDSSASRVPRLVEQGPVTAISSTVSGQTIAKTWFPTPILLPGGSVDAFLNVVMVNVDADVLQLDALFYLFNLDVRQKTPMGPLLWARGAT